jgi:hypothetical protein
MTYEYHLEDGTIEISTEPSITSFEKYIYNFWDEEVQDMVTEYVDVPVKYCVIKDEVTVNC